MVSSISPGADAGDLADRQIPTVAASGYRERAIKEYLLGLGGTDGLSVRCVPNERTAYIEQDTKEKAPTITIPAKDWDQPFTEFDQEAANRLIQYGLALHEHGHDRYTPGPYLKTIFDRQQWEQPQNESLYWNFINAFEDHRIESALIEDEGKWAEERLQFVGQTLLYCAPEDVPNRTEMSWASALRSASIHYGKGRERLSIIPALEDSEDERLQWRSDVDKHVYYFVLPGLKATLDDVAGQPDGKAAVDRMIEFDQQLDTFLDALDDEPDRDREQEDATSDDGSDRNNDMGGQKEPADSLEQDSDGTSEEGDEDGEGDGEDDAEGDTGEGSRDDTNGSDTGDDAESEDAGDGASSDGGEEAGDSEQQPDSAGEEGEDDSDSDGQDADGSSETDGAPDADSDAVDGQDGDSDAEDGPQGDEESGATGDEAGDSGSNSEDASPADDGDESESSSGGDSESDSGGEDKTASEDSEQSTNESAGEQGQDGAEENTGDAGSDADGEASQPSTGEDHSDNTEAGKSGRQQAAEESDSASEGEGATADDTTDSSDSSPEPPSEGLQQKEARKALQESRRLERDKERLEQEIHLLQQAMEGGDGTVTQIEMVEQSAEAANPDVWDDIVEEGRFLKPPLSAALQNTRQSEERRGTRTGTFDPKLSRRLSIGNLAVNKHNITGEELEYAVIIVLDRSGSMAGQMTEAEVAAGGFARALEDLDINVAVIDLYRSRARMVKPFGTATDQVRGGLTSGDVGGGTPLTDALVLSRERVKQERQRPFMFVISDGLPSDKARYLDELEKTGFPVIGINIGNSATTAGFEECYDVCRAAAPDSVSDELQTLARRVMF